jgi:hypothetical protein
MEEPANFADDPAIADDVDLWRRILPQWVVKDENTGELRPSSAAFDDSPDGSPMSVVIEKIAMAQQISPAKVLNGYVGYGLCAFTAGLARALELSIATRPEVHGEPAHGFVVGKKTRSVRKKLSKASRWVILSPSSS